MAAKPAPAGYPEWNLVVHQPLERWPAVADEPMADMILRFFRRLARFGYGALGNILFCDVATCRQFLDGLAIAIARVEIHARVNAGRVVLERRLDQARTIEKILPLDRGDADQVGQRPGDTVGIVECLEESDEVRRRKWSVHRRKQPGTGVDEDFQAGEPQHGRKRPQLADRQWRVFLISLHELHQARQRKLHVRIVQIAVCQRQNARDFGILAVFETGQFLVELFRHVARDLTAGAPDLVLVVAQPLGCLGGMRLGVGGCRAQGAQPVGHTLQLSPGSDAARLSLRQAMTFGECARRASKWIAAAFRRRQHYDSGRRSRPPFFWLPAACLP